MHEKPLGLGCMHENKIFFVFEMRVYFLIFFGFFSFFIFEISEKII